MLAMLAIGFWQQATGQLQTLPQPEVLEHTLLPLSLLLILRAFASGCTALTGVEAISNGIMAFTAAAEQERGGRRCVVMSALLGVMFIGITVLANHVHVIAGENVNETVISQVARSFMA